MSEAAQARTEATETARTTARERVAAAWERGQALVEQARTQLARTWTGSKVTKTLAPSITVHGGAEARPGSLTCNDANECGCSANPID
jgi:hypothetical protein